MDSLARSLIPVLLLCFGGCAARLTQPQVAHGAKDDAVTVQSRGADRAAVDGSADGAPAAQRTSVPSPWQADLGDGYYQNPILYADYSDPDVISVGDDFYMTASSFNAAPGLPILHSTDLVNWELVNHALPQIVPVGIFNKPQHGNGVWAPSLRYHAGKFWIFYPDPDFGIYLTTAEDPAQAWSAPRLILPGKGLIDPTPLWDNDGQAYLLHGWAKSRAGINNILTLHRMSPDGATVEPQGKVIIDGHKLKGYKTVEGPKLYQRNGYYYVFAPAGGVPVGWQAVFRSKSIHGPYEFRTVMEQGNTLINGPHQGAWVHTPSGEDWFVHFQSRGSYGRVVHLQPMSWHQDWPVIGADPDGDGIGNPVTVYKKPLAPRQTPMGPRVADDFSEPLLGLQWQWNANFSRDWYSLTASPGELRLYAQPETNPQTKNLWMFPALLLQKLPAPEFHAQTTLSIPDGVTDVTAGMILFGEDYRWVGLRVVGDQVVLGSAECKNARAGCEEKFRPVAELTTREVTLRITVTAGGLSVSGYLDAEGRFHANDELFQARPGRWVGAKIGLFARTHGGEPATAQRYARFSEFDISQPEKIRGAASGSLSAE